MVRGCFNSSGPSWSCPTWKCSVPSDHPQRTRAGYRKQVLSLESSNYLTGRHDADHPDTGSFDRLASSLFTID